MGSIFFKALMVLGMFLILAGMISRLNTGIFFAIIEAVSLQLEEINGS